MKKKNKIIVGGVLSAGVGIGAIILYNKLKGKTLSSLSDLFPALTNLAPLPAERLSESAIQNIATEAAQTVSQSTIDAQNQIIAAEKEASAAEQKIVELNASLLSLNSQIENVNVTITQKNEIIAQKKAATEKCQIDVIAKQTVENEALNVVNASISSIEWYRTKIAELINDYRNKYGILYVTNPNFLSKKSQLQNELNTATNTKLAAEREYNNAKAAKTYADNALNVAIAEQDAVEKDLLNFRATTLDPLVAQKLALETTINTYSIAYQAANEKIAALKKELGIV